MTVANVTEQIARVAEDYRADGYDVVVAPGAAEIPFNLGGHRPDLLVQKGSDRVLVEVKSRADRLSFDQLHAVVKEVRRHPGWRFVLVTPQDIPGIDFKGDDDDPSSWEEIESRMNRAQTLFDSGESEAAFLCLWIAFERLLRLQVRRISLPVDRLAPSIMIRQLYSLGEVSSDEYQTALECLNVRNRVVHGLSSPGLPKVTIGLFDLVRELLATWRATADTI
jgi:REase_AHJR-like